MIDVDVFGECIGLGARVVGVAGACAIWAMVPPPTSTDRMVVGFVLAAPLRKVRGSERYEEDEREGAGEGGEVGGSGRVDASSSASTGFVGDQIDPGASEEEYLDAAVGLPGMEPTSTVRPVRSSPRLTTRRVFGALRDALTVPAIFFCSQFRMGLLPAAGLGFFDCCDSVLESAAGGIVVRSKSSASEPEAELFKLDLSAVL